MKWNFNYPESQIDCRAQAEGESIEEKMRKVTTSKEPIDNVAPLIFTDRKDGILPQYDHRTDRFELARQAKDRVGATRAAMIQAATEQAKQAAEQAKEGKTTNNAEA